MTSRRTNSEVDRQIDENLRRVYDDVLNEAVPDRFLDLINDLKASRPADDPVKKNRLEKKDSDDA